MNHTEDIDLANVLPGVDLALWLRLIVCTIVVAVLGVWALTAL